eukprot:GILI01030116.1.p1 GENE.GILI01030116.1~~GILI01030116.1.p1  ORF type:complete len:201 (-),score=29.80 GILI01030116.1:94-696(-)
MPLSAQKVVEIRRKLNEDRIFVSDRWLQECLEHIELCYAESGSVELFLNSSVNEAYGGVLEQVYDNDLAQIIESSQLPPNVTQSHDIFISGRHFVQIDEITNIAESIEHQENDSNRMLKLCLTDGLQQFFGIEFERVSSVNFKTPAGCKVMLVGPIQVRRGLLLLRDMNLKVVGGKVEALVEKSQTAVQQRKDALRAAHQ